MEMALDVALALASLAVIAQQIWALRGHFTSERMAPGARLTSLAVIVSAAIYLMLVFTIAQPAWAQVTALVLEAASVWLFWGAIRASRAAQLRYAFDDTKPQTLVVEGPYRHVRHPFYTSYLIFWTGWTIGCWSLWGLVPLAVLACLYVIAARHEEDLFAGSALSDAYAAYRRRAGLFWPRLGG